MFPGSSWPFLVSLFASSQLSSSEIRKTTMTETEKRTEARRILGCDSCDLDCSGLNLPIWCSYLPENYEAEGRCEFHVTRRRESD